MLIVIDYSVGNVKSVCNAFDHLGCPVELSCDRRKIEAASALVLPGVAAFGFAVNALGPLGSVIKDLALAGKPLLGICVGFQMLFDKSSEFGIHKGLSLVSGDVVDIPPGRVIPHMGWNKVVLPNNMALFQGLGSEKHFYFAHSFYFECIDSRDIAATCHYGSTFTCATEHERVLGVQFHPEKSHRFGMALFRRFADLPC